MATLITEKLEFEGDSNSYSFIPVPPTANQRGGIAAQTTDSSEYALEVKVKSNERAYAPHDATKLDRSVDAANAGKLMGVNNAGNIEPMALSTDLSYQYQEASRTLKLGGAVAEGVTTSSDVQREFSYVGERINLSKRTYDCRLFGACQQPPADDAPQGMGIYDHYMVMCHNSGSVTIYDMEPFTGIPIQNVTLGSHDTYQHANTLTFGKVKMAESDTFPLLYTTGGSAGKGEKGYCAVDRLIGTPGSLTSVMVQKIEIDYSGFEAAGYTAEYAWPNMVTDGNYLYSFGSVYRSNGSKSDLDNVNRFILHKFALPDPSAGNVVLTAADILQEFVYPYDVFFMQGATIFNGMLFHAFGCGGSMSNGPVPKPRNDELRVYDIVGGRELAKVNLQDLPFAAVEPEACAVYNGKLYISFLNYEIYELEF